MSDSADAAPASRDTSVIAIFGPTGIGKTAIAIELAALLRARGEDPVAISVDSMQVYRQLPIITGTVTAVEQLELEHQLVGHIDAADEYDVATHARSAHAAIDAALDSGRRPLVVGGTGLYLRAALTTLDLLPAPSSSERDELEAELTQFGPEVMFERLVEADPLAASQTDARNPRRVLRTLEAIQLGRSPSDRSENRLWTSEMRVPTDLFALTMERPALYKRINQRVDRMVADGAVEEVAAAVNAGMGRTASQALGVDELTVGDVEQLKTNTRRYAKRQLTWLRKLAGAHTIDVTGKSDGAVAELIAAQLTS